MAKLYTYLFSNCFLILAMLCYSSQLHTQDQLPINQVEVLKEFKSQLTDIDKLDLSIRAPQKDTQKLSFTYQITDTDYPSDVTIGDLPKLSLYQNNTKDLYNNYVELALGYPSLVQSSAFLSGKLNPTLQAYVTGNYYTSDGSSLHAFKKLKLKSGIHWQIHQTSQFNISAHLHQFNIPYNIIPNNTDSAREHRAQLYGFSAQHLYGNSEERSFNLHTDIAFSRFSDNLAVREFNFKLHPTWHTKFNAHWTAGAGIKIDFLSLTDTFRVDRNLNHFGILPFVQYFNDQWSAEAKLNLLSEKDNYYTLYRLTVGYSLPSNTQITLAYNKDIQRNTLQDMYSYCPYIRTRLDTYYSSKVNELYILVEKKIQQFNIHAKLAYIQNNAHPVYYRNATESYLNTSNPELQYIQLNSNLNYYKNQWIHPNLTLIYNLFLEPDASEHFHIPNLSCHVSNRITFLKQKASAEIAIQIVEGLYNVADKDRTTKLDPGIQVNLSGQYQFSPRWSTYAKVLNAFNQTNSRWDGIPDQGIHLFCGLRFKF